MFEQTNKLDKVASSPNFPLSKLKSGGSADLQYEIKPLLISSKFWKSF